MRSALLASVLLLAGCASDQYGIGGKPAEVSREVVKLGVADLRATWRELNT